MIEKAEEYIWENARVLEQRRFELLFKGGDAQPVIDAVKPYKTPDGGYGYALEPDGRGPTSQPPHIWTALEALEDAGTTDETHNYEYRDEAIDPKRDYWYSVDLIHTDNSRERIISAWKAPAKCAGK